MATELGGSMQWLGLAGRDYDWYIRMPRWDGRASDI